MIRHSLRRRWLLPILLSSLALTACGGGSGVPADTASGLARRADTVAARLADGDPCGAAEQLSALQAAVQQAETSGDLPHDTATAILDTTDRVSEGVTCPPPAQPSVSTGSGATTGVDGGRDNGGRDNGGKDNDKAGPPGKGGDKGSDKGGDKGGDKGKAKGHND